MSLRQKRAIFLAVWLILIIPGPIAANSVTSFSGLSGNLAQQINFLQRVIALLAFSMLSFQIILGAFMARFTEKLGGWAFRFHVLHGALLYSLVVAHPLFFVLFNYKSQGVLDPFYVFTQVCVICPEPIEIWYTLGRISFWLITVAVLAAKLRKESWWMVHWRKFHLLNYIAFFLVAVHAFTSGTDVKQAPFVWVYWFSVAAVSLSVFYDILPALKSGVFRLSGDDISVSIHPRQQLRSFGRGVLEICYKLIPFLKQRTR